jgi:hypothetical protein
VREGDYVIAHGRFSGHGLPRNWITADIVRIESGVLVEHWDVIEDESSEANSTGISASSVQRIWRAHGLQPHRVQQFKLSNDPKFIDKLRDVVGLYVDPPAHAIVLSVDEKAQIQALDRTQPGLPMKKGRAGTMTHDYKRHGTTTLFAALDVLEGKVIGRCMQRHRHQEFHSNRVSSNQIDCVRRCRETEFSGQRQRGRNGFEGSRTPLQRQNLAKQPRQFGASLRELGNLR